MPSASLRALWNDAVLEPGPRQGPRVVCRVVCEMIEICLGFLAIIAAAGIALGLGDGLVPFPLGSGVVVAIALAGATLVLHGRHRLQLKRGEQHAVRSAGLALFTSALAVVTALALPALSETFNLVSVGGFPLGTYLLGQGVLIVFAALLFFNAARQRHIDKSGEP